jgi:exodeoxyribonuclease VII small subunit
MQRPAAQAGPPATPTANPADDVSTLLFDQALEELRSVVARLEEGGLPLEGSIALYERGAALHEHCARLVDGSAAAPRLVDLRPDDGDDL